MKNDTEGDSPPSLSILFRSLSVPVLNSSQASVATVSLKANGPSPSPSFAPFHSLSVAPQDSSERVLSSSSVVGIAGESRRLSFIENRSGGR